MPITVDQLRKAMSITVTLPDKQTLLLHKLSEFDFDVLNWLSLEETTALPARTFAQHLIHKLLVSPDYQLEEITLWPDKQLVKILAHWLFKQKRFQTKKQAESCALEELKQAVCDYGTEQQEQGRKAISDTMKNLVTPVSHFASLASQGYINRLLKDINRTLELLPSISSLYAFDGGMQAAIRSLAQSQIGWISETLQSSYIPLTATINNYMAEIMRPSFQQIFNNQLSALLHQPRLSDLIGELNHLADSVLDAETADATLPQEEHISGSNASVTSESELQEIIPALHQLTAKANQLIEEIQARNAREQNITANNERGRNKESRISLSDKLMIVMLIWMVFTWFVPNVHSLFPDKTQPTPPTTIPTAAPSTPHPSPIATPHSSETPEGK